MLDAILLGLLQGITEFLPISSTAHMYIAAKFLNLHEPGHFFISWVQLGTSCALVLYFFRDIKGIICQSAKSIYSFIQSGHKGGEKREYTRLGLLLLAGTIPAGLLGVVALRFLPTGLDGKNLLAMGVALILFGILLGAADAFFWQKRGDIFRITLSQAILIGVSQVFAIIPGVSRSGITITTGRVLQFDRQLAVRFSFLLSLPLTFMSGIFGVISEPDTDYYSWGNSLLGAVAAFTVGLLSVGVLMRFISKNTFVVFVYYRVLFGLFLVIISFI